ncbi:hypothetical protein B0I37DRAFT_117240 [Chaetomium sp. MPI-CAGE-AT-0009]|nr:hypothetical protein B0I37DRAFT_117240 [Chaetomium sp. MPI-CAGE-AT-0009]
MKKQLLDHSVTSLIRNHRPPLIIRHNQLLRRKEPLENTGAFCHANPLQRRHARQAPNALISVLFQRLFNPCGHNLCPHAGGGRVVDNPHRFYLGSLPVPITARPRHRIRHGSSDLVDGRHVQGATNVVEVRPHTSLGSCGVVERTLRARASSISVRPLFPSTLSSTTTGTASGVSFAAAAAAAAAAGGGAAVVVVGVVDMAVSRWAVTRSPACRAAFAR